MRLARVIVVVVLGPERLEHELLGDEAERWLEVVSDEGHPSIVARHTARLMPSKRTATWKVAAPPARRC